MTTEKPNWTVLSDEIITVMAKKALEWNQVNIKDWNTNKGHGWVGVTHPQDNCGMRIVNSCPYSTWDLARFLFATEMTCFHGVHGGYHPDAPTNFVFALSIDKADTYREAGLDITAPFHGCHSTPAHNPSMCYAIYTRKPTKTSDDPKLYPLIEAVIAKRKELGLSEIVFQKGRPMVESKPKVTPKEDVVVKPKRVVRKRAPAPLAF